MVLIQGQIQDLVRGGAKLTQWQRMRCLSLRTRMYSSKPVPTFSQRRAKKKKKRSPPTATPIIDHHLTFLQLLELPCAPLPPSPLQ